MLKDQTGKHGGETIDGQKTTLGKHASRAEAAYRKAKIFRVENWLIDRLQSENQAI